MFALKLRYETARFGRLRRVTANPRVHKQSSLSKPDAPSIAVTDTGISLPTPPLFSVPEDSFPGSRQLRPKF